MTELTNINKFICFFTSYKLYELRNGLPGTVLPQWYGAFQKEIEIWFPKMTYKAFFIII